MRSISLTIERLVEICREQDVEPNRVRLSPKSYQLLCKDEYATYVVSGLKFVIDTKCPPDNIYVDRIPRGRYAKYNRRITASQVTLREGL